MATGANSGPCHLSAGSRQIRKGCLFLARNQSDMIF